VEKATGWQREEIERLPRNHSIQYLLSQPGIQFGIFKFFAYKPLVFFFAVSDPAYKIFAENHSLVQVVPCFQCIYMHFLHEG
jgi:hypothetical protein